MDGSGHDHCRRRADSVNMKKDRHNLNALEIYSPLLPEIFGPRVG